MRLRRRRIDAWHKDDGSPRDERRARDDRPRRPRRARRASCASAATASSARPVRDGAIVYEEIASADELPAGWTEVQEAGSYRLERRDDEARFGYPVGPHSWKRYLLPARVRLWQATQRDGGAPELVEEPPPDRPFALLGVRSCDLHAIAVQDRVFLEGAQVERDYAGRRDGAFLVAVNCGTPGGTCFCVSMGTGPRAQSGYDLVLTELLDGEHRFLAEAGTRRGAEVLASARRRGRDAVRRRRVGAGDARRRGADGPHARVVRPARPARAQPRPSALRRDRRPLPHLRQLHARLPDVLLHLGRGRQRPRRRADGRALAQLGLVLLGRLLAISTAAPCGPRRGRATASGSRTSSAPGSTSSAPPGASAAGAASPGARSGSTSPRSSPRSGRPTGRWIMQTLDQIVGESPVFDGLDAAQLELIAGCGHIEAVQTGHRLFREGDPAETFYLVRRGRIALTTHVPGRGDVVIETLEPGEVIGWSWLFPPYELALRRARGRGRRRGRVRRHVPARQVRGRPRARLRADAPLRAGADRPAAARREPGSWTCMATVAATERRPAGRWLPSPTG